MYIKIKYIKYAFLGLACLFLTSHLYSGYINADDEYENIYNDTSATNTDSEDAFVDELKDFMLENDGKTVSATDLSNFIDEKIITDSNGSISFDSLGYVSVENNKIISQKYGEMTVSQKKEQLQKDFIKYLYDVSYIFINNIPTKISSKKELELFQEDFKNHLSDLSDQNNINYFIDLGDRLEVISNQLLLIDVPETVLEIHIKFLKIINGFLSLKNDETLSIYDSEDMNRLLLLSKINGLISLIIDFLNNDFIGYIKNNLN